MTKNYIFDFGNVLVEFEPVYMTKQYIDDLADIQLVSEIVFDRLYWDKLDAGTVSDGEVKRLVCQKLPERLWDSANKVYDNWYRHLPEINGMRAVVLRLKKEGHGLYLLSNISEYFAQNYHKVTELNELFSLFDGVVFSAPIHMVKPMPEIFEYLVKKYGLKTEECTFIDDNVNNVDGAKKLGIQGILFHGNVSDLEKEIW